jgi:putative ABC transport system substrate-binding protein
MAANRATSRIPIVIYASGDPVHSGLVASLARPGGNITGNTSMSPDLGAKRLELIRELLPAAVRVASLSNPVNPVDRFARKYFEEASRSLGLQPIIVEVAASSESDSIVTEVVRRGGQALIVDADPMFAGRMSQIMRDAQRLGLPLLVPSGASDDAFWLISLDARWDELARQTSSLVDPVRVGDQPQDGESSRNHRPAMAAAARGRNRSVREREPLHSPYQIPAYHWYPWSSQ